MALPGGNLSTDVPMDTLVSEIQNLRTTIANLEARTNDTSRVVQRLTSPDETRETQPRRPPKSTIAKVQYFSNNPGENFLSWRIQFQVIANINEWSNTEAKGMAFAYMKGHALDTVLDIDIKRESETLEDLLGRYQMRFLPASRSQMLRAQFNHVVQLPNESIQRLHARMRVLYNLAYPDIEDRSNTLLTERFVAALTNREVQNNVRRRKPESFEKALEIANEETSFVLMDLATHAPGGLQQPLPGDSSYIAALQIPGQPPRLPPRGRNPGFPSSDKRCFYCEGTGHLKDRCPLRLKDLMQQRSQGLPRLGDQTGRNPFRLQEKGNTNPFRMNSPAPPSRKPSGSSATHGRQVRFSADTRQTWPYVSDGYARGHVAALDSQTEDIDPQDDLDFMSLDEQTIAALYAGLQDNQQEDEEDPQEEDFP